MITVAIKNLEGKEIEKLDLDADVFNDQVSPSTIYQVINGYRLNQRKGCASTKTRGEVSGGGKKPWKQKGTGRARVGSNRSPLWRHGGVVFGPHPRDFSYTIPKRIKNQALKYALLQKIQEENFIVLDKLVVENPKTKEIIRIMKNLKANHKNNNILLLIDKPDQILKKAAANLGYLSINLAKDVNTYDVMVARKLIITSAGLNELVARLRKDLS